MVKNVNILASDNLAITLFCFIMNLITGISIFSGLMFISIGIQFIVQFFIHQNSININQTKVQLLVPGILMIAIGFATILNFIIQANK